ALPAGKINQDEFFGRVETYRGSVTVNLAVRNFTPGKPLVIHAESQGSADDADGDGRAACREHRPRCARSTEKNLVQLTALHLTKRALAIDHDGATAS